MASKQAGSFPVKPTKVPSKLRSVGTSDLSFVPSNLIPRDQFTVHLASVSTQDTLTFHRAIGFVDPEHSADAWYCTRASDIQDLVNNKRNPGQAQLEQSRQTAIQAELATAGLLLMVGGVACYPGGTRSRKEVVADARKAVTAKEKESHGAKAFMIHLTDAERTVEETISKRLGTQDDGSPSAIRTKVLAAHPDTYRTRSGPGADKDQHIVPYLEGLSTEQAVAEVRRRLMGLNT